MMTPPQDPPRKTPTSRYSLGLLTGASQVIPPCSASGLIPSTGREKPRPPHGGAPVHRTFILPIAPVWGMRLRIVHPIQHHPRTRRRHTFPNVAVVRIAAKNVLLKKAPKYLMSLSLSFVLWYFVQALILRIPLVPHHSNNSTRTAGTFMKAPFRSLFQPISLWPTS